MAPIFVDDDGRNVIVIVPGANMGLTPDDVVRARDVITAASVVICQLEVPVETTLEALRIGRTAGEGTVIITLGERGALLADTGVSAHFPAVAVPAVASTGAGDAFVGGPAVLLAEGVPLVPALERANAVAALSVTEIGTQVSFPSRGDADAFLREEGLL